MAALSIKRSIGEGGSPDHGSFPFADYEYLWPRVSCVKAGGFPGQLFLHWHSRWTPLYKICILYNGFTSVLLFTRESRRTFCGEWERNFNFSIISDSLVGGIVCHYCNSKEGECSTNSLYGTREYSCGGDYHHCALYRKVLPNGTTAQVVRSCERDCNRPVMRWTVGKYQKTSHCKLCCDSDFCNGQLTDPCSNSTRLTSEGFLVILLVILGLCAWYSDIHLKGAQQVYIWHKTINF